MSPATFIEYLLIAAGIAVAIIAAVHGLHVRKAVGMELSPQAISQPANTR